MKAVADLIRQHFPTVAASRIEALPHPGWGGDSDAWLVDERWIFRFPRTAEVAAALAIEVCLLPQLATRLPLPIPRFVHVARDENERPLFVGYKLIPGEPLRDELLRQLSQSDRDLAANDLGTFLRTLHQTPVDVAIDCGLTAPTRTAREALEAQYRAVREKVFPRLDADERGRIGRRFETFLADPRHFEFSAVLCHGDLSSDHILVDSARNTLTGIIDFGDVQIGDPAGEFTWRAEYGEAFFDKALEAYAIADESFAERVAFRIDCLPLSQIAYGVDTNAEAEIQEGIRWLRRQTSSLTPRRRL